MLAYLSGKYWTESMVLQLPSRVLEVELTLASSNYHTEMNPSDVGNNDRYVVQEILKVGPCTDGTLQVPHVYLCIHDYDSRLSLPWDVHKTCWSCCMSSRIG